MARFVLLVMPDLQQVLQGLELPAPDMLSNQALKHLLQVGHDEQDKVGFQVRL